MNTHIISKHDPIVYNGHSIDWRGDELSLTGMWKANGSDPQKAPAKWRALPSAKTFIEHVEFTIGKSDSELIRTVNGGKKPGTWAHWQIGMAYAKYLDPNFHMVCNQIVRERMEGKSGTGLSTEALEQIDRSFGIMRMLAHKVTEMEKTVGVIAMTVQPHQPMLMRHGKTAGQIWNYHQLPKIKNGATWLGNRLAEMRCLAEGRGELGGRTARLFDPDLAETCMKNGLLQKAKQYSSERMGQKKLRLVGGGAA